MRSKMSSRTSKNKADKVDIDKVLKDLNDALKADRTADRSSNHRNVTDEETLACSNSSLRKGRLSENKSKVTNCTDFENRNKNELFICLNTEIKKIKDENRKISKELEERKRELKEMGIRLEKIEIIIEKKNKTEEERNKQLEQMVDYIEKIREEGKRLEEKVKKYEKGVTHNIEEHLDKRMKELKEIREEEDENRKVEAERYNREIQELKWHNEMQERKGKRNNIIIRGMKKGIKRSKEDMEKWLKEKLEININTNNTWTIKGSMENEELIGVELASWEEKKKVMRRKSKLKGKERNVFIDNDLTWQERKVRRFINNKKAEVKKNDQNTEVKVGYYWIEIDKVRFVYDERKKEPGLIRIQE